MAIKKKPGTPPLFLGIDAGGTRTVALMSNAAGLLVKRAEFGPANLRLLSERQLTQHFYSIARDFAHPDAVGIGMAGVRHAQDEQRILRAATKAWPLAPSAVSHDLEITLRAAEQNADHELVARVIVLSGTGSCCYGRSNNGKIAKVGGWGHLLGDKASGYEIGLRSLKAVVYHFDRNGIWPLLGQRILQATQLNEPEELIGWAQHAEKKEIAALAIEVFNARKVGDRIARDILESAAYSLAKDAITCARRLAKPGSRVQFVLTGSVLLKQPGFARRVGIEIKKLWPGATVAPLKMESVWGAIQLAKKQFGISSPSVSALRGTAIAKHESTPENEPAHSRPAGASDSVSAALSPTEQRNPRSMNLSKLPISKAIALMLSEDAKIPAAILEQKKKIERAIDWIVRAFRNGGRLFYVGAGTSGRLGVLDASECPPTFRARPDQVQGIIAGGQSALWTSVEGAEDDASAGARSVQFRGIDQKDVVVGIAASGRTPFVLGGLDEAKRRRAKTILLCFNPALEISPDSKPDLIIAPATGPEVLTGSTRLKAGTATKIILNLLTTLSMVRLGKVVGNLMVDLNPANTKLRDRAVRIVQSLTGVNSVTAREALESSGWVVKKAWTKLRARRI